MTDSMPNIGFFPDYSDANPYQRELAEALENKGNSVEFFEREISIYDKVRKENLDLIHLHWLEPYISGESFPETLLKSCSAAVKLLLLKLKGYKIVWTAHNIESHDEEYSRIEKLFKLFCTIIIFDKIIAHCVKAQEKLEKNYRAGEEQVNIIVHGNYTSSYPNNIAKTEARENLNLDSENTVFLFFGQIRKYKGVDNLVERFKETDNEEAVLIIAGKAKDTKLVSDIKKKFSEDSRIRIHDRFISDQDVQIYMNASDCVVLPYQEITTSGALILAMSFGKPVIAPEKGCIPEHVSREDAILFKSTDKIGESIQRYLDQEVTEKGERNLEKARQMDWNSIAQKTDKIYRELN